MAPTKEAILPILLTILFTVLILKIRAFSDKSPLAVSNNKYVNSQVNFQLALVVLSGFSLLATFLLSRSGFLHYFSFGQIAAPAQELNLFRIRQGDRWLETGLSLCVVISLTTGVFMYVQLKGTRNDWATVRNGIGWVLVFSLTNSFAEEMIFRIGLIAPLAKIVSPDTLFFVSALIFGLAHFWGMPNGIIGVLLAGVLGYVLAKSVYETNGFFWAWTIHFLQDILIIGSLYLMDNAKSLKLQSR